MATLPLSQEGATVVHPGIRAGTHLPTSHMPWTQEPWLLWTPVLGCRRCRRCGLARALHWFRTPACGPSVSSVEAGAPLQPGPRRRGHSAQPVPWVPATLSTSGVTAIESATKSQTWNRDSFLGQNFPCGREEIQKSPEAFAMKDPNSPHYCSGRLPHALQRTPVIFAKADLS